MGLIGWFRYGSNPQKLLEKLEEEDRRLLAERNQLEKIRDEKRKYNARYRSREYVELPFERDIQLINE